MTTTNLFANRATAKLAVALSSGDTAITLVPGGGDWFPTPAANEFFRLVVQKGSGQTDQREYMLCTGRAGDVLTVTRGQEGTPAANFAVGDEASLVVTKVSFDGLVQKIGPTLQGALEVEADPTTPLGIATKQFVESGRLPDAPADGKDYARKDLDWHALGAAAGLAVPIPITAGGTGGATLPEAQLNLIIGLTSIDDLAPATPKYGDRWIKPSNMTEMVWVPNQGTTGGGVWVNPADAQSEAYPIVIAKGGTGAITAPAALTNLGGTAVGTGVFTAATAAAARTVLGITNANIGSLPIDGSGAMTGVLKIADGTVAAPGLAFASEVGLGLYRTTASQILMAAGGLRVMFVDAGTATATNIGLNPRAAGSSQISFRNQAAGVVNYNQFTLAQNADGNAFIGTGVSGTATRGWLYLDAPNVVIPGTGELSVQSGGGSMGMSCKNPSYNILGMAIGNGGGWAWMFERATGLLSWTNSGGGALASINSVGQFVATGDIYSNGGGMGFKASDNANYPKVMFTSNGWRFEWDATTGNLGWKRNDNTTTILFDYGGNAYKLSAGSTWGNLSDIRAKGNIRDWREGLDKVLALRPVIFDRTDTGEKDAVGLIADEAELVMPEMVKRSPGPIGEVEYEDRAIMTIDPMFYAMVNAIKTLHARVQQLEKQK
ncbi:MAG TPA: tail fiber domain-containing protein [Vicinamibacterales bacterium]